MEMKPQKYNWPLLVRETMDAAFLPQTAMADRLKVSQQSVSNWLTGKRNPRAHVIPGLLKLAQDIGLDIGSYEPNSDFDGITEYMKKNKGRELVRLFDLYGRMSNANRQKFISYAEKTAHKR